MDLRMYLNCIWIPLFQAIYRRSPPVRGTVISYPKNAARRSERLLAHDQIDQIVETVDTGTMPTQTEDFGAYHITIL